MNTRIARLINEARKKTESAQELHITCHYTEQAYNTAIKLGFIEDLPTLKFVKVFEDDNCVTVMVTPHSGYAELKDLYNIKSVWGADDLHISTENKEMVICLSFNF